jgi:hypothetical protein
VFDSCTRAVPNDYVNIVADILTEYEVTRPALVDAFLAVYETQVAKVEMRKQFDFQFHFITLGPPEHLKTLAPKLFESEKQKAHRLIVDAEQKVASAMRVAAYDLVEKLANALTGDGKRFNDAHVDNLMQFVNSFDVRNVTNDSELKVEIDKLKQLMAGVSAERIRHREGLKLALSSTVAEVAKAIGVLSYASPCRHVGNFADMTVSHLQ